MKTVEVKVSAKSGSGKTGANYGENDVLKNSAKLNYSISAENMSDVQSLAGTYGNEDEKKNPLLFVGNAVQNYIEYAKGLRNGIRNDILELIEGPEKVINKQVKAVAPLFGGDENKAREFVLAQRKSLGQPVA